MKNSRPNLIGISGKLESGKDTVAKMIQYLTCVKRNYGSHYSKEAYFGNHPVAAMWLENHSNWKIKKYADKLKDIACLLIGCTREQLEDREFKEKELGEEWWKYCVSWSEYGKYDAIHTNYTEAQKSLINLGGSQFDEKDAIVIVKSTPRLLLQLLGTECGRQILHPNIWVNALFAEYTPQHKQRYQEANIENILTSYGCLCRTCKKRFLSRNKRAYMCNDCVDKQEDIYPNWIITDVRFPNEVEAIEKRGGFVIRVNRKWNPCYCGHTTVCECLPMDEHESETALDDHSFEEVINNDSSLEDLVTKVREVLVKRQIIV